MKIKVKPTKKDLIVKDELGRVIPEKGKYVTKTVFIVRRIKEGSLEIVEPIAKKKTKGD